MDKYLVKCKKANCTNYRSGVCVMCFKKCPNATIEKVEKPIMHEYEQFTVSGDSVTVLSISNIH